MHGVSWVRARACVWENCLLRFDASSHGEEVEGEGGGPHLDCVVRAAGGEALSQRFPGKEPPGQLSSTLSPFINLVLTGVIDYGQVLTQPVTSERLLPLPVFDCDF